MYDGDYGRINKVHWDRQKPFLCLSLFWQPKTASASITPRLVSGHPTHHH
jgi:hypothetical protein